MPQVIKDAIARRTALVEAAHTLYDAKIYLPKKGIKNPLASPFGYSLPMELTNQPGTVVLGSFMGQASGQLILIQGLGHVYRWEELKESFYAADTQLINAQDLAIHSVVGFRPTYTVVAEYSFYEHQLIDTPPIAPKRK